MIELRWVDFASPERAAIVELRREVLRKPLGLEFSSQELAAETKDLHLGLWEAGCLLGCLLLRETGDGELRMRQVAVAESARRRGLGRRLVLASEIKAKELGFKRMVLHARQNAVAFYQSLGYAASGESFHEVGLPHLFMSKTL